MPGERRLSGQRAVSIAAEPRPGAADPSSGVFAGRTHGAARLNTWARPHLRGVDLPIVVLRGVMPGAAITGDAQIGSRSTRIGMDLWCGMGSKEPGPAG